MLRIPQGHLHIAQVPQGEQVQITQDSEVSRGPRHCPGPALWSWSSRGDGWESPADTASRSDHLTPVSSGGRCGRGRGCGERDLGHVIRTEVPGSRPRPEGSGPEVLGAGVGGGKDLLLSERWPGPVRGYPGRRAASSWSGHSAGRERRADGAAGGGRRHGVPLRAGGSLVGAQRGSRPR